jgi:demethylmenaquinone methyltransferase/2-methoxy-6-polyprenyl-1,4-benzoquinol methylase
MTVIPYRDREAGKKEQVQTMFDAISPKYDFLNHFLSAGTDIRWRKKAIRILSRENPKTILDVATGTGDFAIAALKTGAEKITGVDISEGMLKVGNEKIRKMQLQDKIELRRGDSENLDFANESFDAVTVAFGVRNFEDLEKGLSEMRRVLKKDGTVVILEFSKPERFPVKQLYHFYFKYILPVVGKLISKDKRAYTYLPESVKAFPQGKEFLNILEKTGFNKVQWIPLSFGISSIYLGRK